MPAKILETWITDKNPCETGFEIVSADGFAWFEPNSFGLRASSDGNPAGKGNPSQGDGYSLAGLLRFGGLSHKGALGGSRS